MRRVPTVLLILLTTAAADLRADIRHRIDTLRQRPDGGYTNETVVITALLVGAAILVIGIIIAKVTTKANNIDLGP